MIALLLACADPDGDPIADTDMGGHTADTAAVGFALSSPDMDPHATSPCLQQLRQAHWCAQDGGTNLNPRLDWTGVPPGAVSLALLLDDLDFRPQGEPYPHWAVFSIPPTATAIEPGASGTDATAALPPGAGEIDRYVGPCSSGANTYRWRLLAFDEEPAGAPPDVAAIEGWAALHGLGEATMCHCPDGDCTSP